MSIELLTPFTKVELEPDQRQETQTSWYFGWKFQSGPQCPFGRCGSSAPTIRVR